MLLIAALLAWSDVEAGLPDWMSGCWEHRTGERWTEECWSTARGGMMIGYSRSGRGERVTEWETMQIVLGQSAAASLEFWAAPRGVGRTRFNLGPSDEGLTFYNVANDYPQRIRYWREGTELLAEIALKDGHRAQRWRYKRVD